MDSSKLPPPPPTNSGTLPSVPPPMSLKPGNHDRGWNDPPVFPDEVIAVIKSAPTKLNKRVPYPGLTSSSPPVPGGFLQSPLLTPPVVVPVPGNVNQESSARNLNILMDPTQQNSDSRPSNPTMLPSTNVEFIPTFPTPAPANGSQGQGQVYIPLSEGNNNEGLSCSISNEDVRSGSGIIEL